VHVDLPSIWATMLFIGTCRAVWVPRQDLIGYAAFDAQLRNVFCHYTVHYTYVYACVSTLEGMPHVFAFGPCDKSTHASK